MSPRAPRRVILASALEMPVELVDEVIEEMAERMSGSEEARRCDGLSFTFTVSDHPVAPARYAVGRAGRVRLTRDDPTPASFHFTGPAATFDSVLRGQSNALAALLRRRIHLSGSLSHVRQLLRLMPTVHRAYEEARQGMMERHSERYDFRF
jgi:hypothetical protein